MLLSVVFLLVPASIHVTRTIDALNIGSVQAYLDGKTCASVDKYGSSNCNLDWDASYTGHVNASLTKDIEKGSELSIDANVDSIIPLKKTCAACGADCTITVPVIHKTYSFSMPPCPISAQSLNQAFQFTLPSALPVKTKVEGHVKVTDAAGALLVQLSLKAEASPHDAMSMVEA